MRVALRRPRPPRVDWEGWAPPGPELRSIRALFRRHRRAAVGAYLLIVLVCAYGFKQAADERARACRGTNELRATLVLVLGAGERTIPQYVREGTLTPEQAARALAQSRSARVKLAPRDCS